MTWDPHQYFTFAGQRLRPALDLIQHVPLENPKTIVDLGCGGGNVTKALRDRWPDAEITGIDNSPEMLAHARREAPAMQRTAARRVGKERGRTCRSRVSPVH